MIIYSEGMSILMDCTYALENGCVFISTGYFKLRAGKTFPFTS